MARLPSAPTCIPRGSRGGSSPRIGAPGGGETVVAIDDGGVATSGPAFRSWRRGDQGLHHIVVPANGQPAEIYWAAVSVAAATCVDANIASTDSIIRGRPALAWLASMRGPARLVRPDGTDVTTGGWPRGATSRPDRSRRH